MKNKNEINELVEHFFRHEAGKMISVLTGIFGSSNINLAEDIVQDTLVEAISHWTYNGIPESREGWLYTVAKNKALNTIKREKQLKKYASDQLHIISSISEEEISLNDMFTEKIICDDQLRMMFMCCHSSISKDSQVALILKTLCGFSISEIARAFLTNNENINKRLVRARKKIKERDIPFEVPGSHELNQRVEAILETIYLLFNEGYSASSGDQYIRFDLCEEAIRLAEIIAKHKRISNESDTLALLALMQLNASRFRAREDKNGFIMTLSEQNRSLWDYNKMKDGFSNLEKAAHNRYISKYHLLAAISAYHCSANHYEATDWKNILELYDKLLVIDNSPIVMLNRAIAISKVRGIEKALDELALIENNEVIKSNHLYYSVVAELQLQINKPQKAKKALERAIELAPVLKEKKMLQKRHKTYFDKNASDDVPFFFV